MREVARSVDAPLALIPVLPRLFEGLDGLGCMPVVTARLLREAGVTSRSRVIDVGCGKGAVAAELARRTGCRVLGIDACPAFIEAANELAARRGVGDRCEFRAGDLRRLPRPARGYDAAVMLNVRPLEEAIPFLRTFVRPGGVYVLDDVIRMPRHLLPEGVSALTREEARMLITDAGDVVIREYVPSAARTAALSRSLIRRMTVNALSIARARPALQLALVEFFRRQSLAHQQLTGPIRPAIWVVRRSKR